MANDWIETTIGDQITLQRGYDITKKLQRPGAIPVVSSGGISSYHDTAQVKAPGVILGRKGIVGSVYYITSDYWPHDTTLWVSDFHGNVPRFVYYFFNSIVSRIARMDVGSANPTLNRNHVHPIEVLWPPIGQQRSIAEILGSLDDKIELNRRTNESLEAVARAIFKAWFIDFEVVKAKASGASSFPGMPQNIFNQLPDDFSDSVLGPIPAGWGVGFLGDHCEINGRSVRSDFVGWIEYVDISSVTVGRLDSVNLVDAGEAPSRARRRVQHGDTIWSCVRPNRKSYLFVHSPPPNRIVSTGFAVLTPQDFGPAFLYHLVTSAQFVSYLVANASGSAYPAVRADHFATAQVLVPPLQIREAFDGQVILLRDLIASNDAELRTLAALRDSLLPKLISGEIRIPAGKGSGDGR